MMRQPKKTTRYEHYCGTTPNDDGYLGRWDTPKSKLIRLEPENYHYFKYMSFIYEINETKLFNEMLADYVKKHKDSTIPLET